MNARARLRDFLRDWREIHALNYADDVGLLAKEEIMLPSMIEISESKITMEWKINDKKWGNKNLRTPISITDYDK
jgi:hypothetical protein